MKTFLSRISNIRDFSMFLSLCVFALAFSACSKDRSNVPTGRVMSEEYSVSGSLSKIEVSDGIRLVVSPDIPEKTVMVVTNEDAQQYVVVEQRQGALNLYVDSKSMPFSKLEVAIYVSSNNFDTFSARTGAIISSKDTLRAGNIEVTADGQSQIDADFECTSMILNVGGMSVFNGSVTAEDFYAGLSANAEVTIGGNVGYFELSTNGSSKLSGFPLSCGTMDISSSGGSFTEITVTALLQGEVSGGSKLYYKGNPPRIILDKTGASVVESVAE